jgi:CheY-like chemotaxis protein
VKRFLADRARESALIIADLRLLNEENERFLDPRTDLSGLKLIRTILKYAGARGEMVPVLAWSSSQLQDSERRALECGADCFLTKPVRFDQENDTRRLLDSILLYLHPVYDILSNAYCETLSVTQRTNWHPRSPETGQMLSSIIRLVRDTIVGGISQSGLHRRGTPSAEAICLGVGAALEICDKSYSDRHSASKAVREFRNAAAHGYADLFGINSLLVGVAVLSIAPQLYEMTVLHTRSLGGSPPRVWSTIDSVTGRLKDNLYRARRKAELSDVARVDRLISVATATQALGACIGNRPLLKDALVDVEKRCVAELKTEIDCQSSPTGADPKWTSFAQQLSSKFG